MNNKECKKLDDVFKGEIDKIFASMPPRAGKSLNSFDNYQIMDKIKELRYIINEQKIAIDECIADYKKLEKENEELSAFIIEQRKEIKTLKNENKDVKKYVVRYQTVITANDFWDAVDKSKEYADLELFEVKEIFLRGDADE